MIISEESECRKGGQAVPSILEVHDLTKKYGDFSAVKAVSFDIREGEIFSLLGPNGAGKTTTISVLSTLYAPTSGDALIAGHSVTKRPDGRPTGDRRGAARPGAVRRSERTGEPHVLGADVQPGGQGAQEPASPKCWNRSA